MRTIEDFLEHFRHQRRWTRRIVAAIPEDHFDWRPAHDAFSCGDLVRHLMQAEIFWRRLLQAAVAGETYDPFGLSGSRDERLEGFREVNVAASRTRRLGSSFSECLDSWQSIQAETEEFVVGLTKEDLEQKSACHPLTGMTGPIWEFLVVMMEHEAHHRGQLSAHLKSRHIDHPTTLWR